ncbi:MAG: hypothetical protein P8X48_05380 [Acidiferrobacteraceae bacterium]|jgi:hypothetical protein
MYSKLKAACFPAADAPPKQFRISGAIFLVVALIVGGTTFAAVMQSGYTSLVPVVLLIPIVVWLIGVHRILWGGTAAQNRSLSAGRVVVTVVLGYGSLMVVSGLLGGLVGLIVTPT